MGHAPERTGGAERQRTKVGARPPDRVRRPSTIHTQSIHDRIVDEKGLHKRKALSLRTLVLVMYRSIALALLFGGTVLAGCRKDRDEDAPRVVILQPGSSITLSVPDTLLVRVEVSDERTVERVTIALTDMNGVPVVPPVVATVNSASATVVRQLPVTREQLATGSYTLAVTASDGRNEGRAFRSVNVQAAPLRQRALFITPPAGHPAPVSIWRIDSTGTLDQYLTLSEFGGGAIDARRLYLCGTFNQPTRGIAQMGGVPSITIPNEGPPGATQPFFRGPIIDPVDGRFYLGSNDGFIRGFETGGPQAFTALSPVDLRSVYTAVAGEWVASLARHQVLGEWRLVTHARISGDVIGQFPLDLEPVAVQHWQGAQVLVFGQRNGAGVVQVRNVQQGGGSDLATFNEGPVAAVARASAGTAYIALPDRIVRFSTASNTVTVVAQGLQAQSLAYDAATGTLYAGSGEQLVGIDPTTGAQATLFSFPHPVGRILPLLNR
jgi:hypothetical protein